MKKDKAQKKLDKINSKKRKTAAKKVQKKWAENAKTTSKDFIKVGASMTGAGMACFFVGDMLLTGGAGTAFALIASLGVSSTALSIAPLTMPLLNNIQFKTNSRQTISSGLNAAAAINAMENHIKSQFNTYAKAPSDESFKKLKTEINNTVQDLHTLKPLYKIIDRNGKIDTKKEYSITVGFEEIDDVTTRPISYKEKFQKIAEKRNKEIKSQELALKKATDLKGSKFKL